MNEGKVQICIQEELYLNVFYSTNEYNNKEKYNNSKNTV